MISAPRPQRAAPPAAPGTVARYVGLDIGGTKTAAIVIDDAGNLGAETLLPTAKGNDGVIRTAVQALTALAAQSGCTVSDFSAAGIGVPGQVDVSHGVVRYAYNLGVQSLELATLLHERTGVAIVVENDVTAAAVGAAHLMKLRGSVCYLNLGTGLSAGIVVEGKPWRGAQNLAGEIGHLPADPRGRRCPCGQRGCLETVASGSALNAHWPAGGEHPGTRLAQAARNGDAAASAALALLVEGAASAVRTLGVTIAPDTVVIGGGLRKIGAPLIEGIREQLRAWQAESPFLRGFALSERLRVLPDGLPAATVGAALAPRL